MGPRGQERLGAARVAVVGTGVAAERVVAHLAAAGVGVIAADPALHTTVDPAQPDCRIEPLARGAGDLDAAVVVAGSIESAATEVAAWHPRARATLWIAAGWAGGAPPCPRCAAAAVVAAATPPELAALRDALLGTVVATETAKTLLAIGTPFAGRVLVYDATTATVTSAAAVPRPGCACG